MLDIEDANCKRTQPPCLTVGSKINKAYYVFRG